MASANASDALEAVVRWAVRGQVPTQANPNGTLVPPTIHYGDYVVDDAQGVYTGSFSDIPLEMGDYIRVAEGEFQELTGQEPNFDLITLHVFRPGTSLNWHDSKYAGKEVDQSIWMSVSGEFELQFGLITRLNEGCDRFGNPYDSDEPVPYSRDYKYRKQLWDRYHENSISHGDYIRMPRKLYQTRAIINTEPVPRAKRTLPARSVLVSGLDLANFDKHYEVKSTQPSRLARGTIVLTCYQTRVFPTSFKPYQAPDGEIYPAAMLLRFRHVVSTEATASTTSNAA